MSNPQSELITRPKATSSANAARFVLFSLIGIFMFFVPITINNTSSIPLDHLTTWIRTMFPSVVPLYALLVILLGAIYPFVKNTWRKDAVTMVFSFLKVAGVVVALMIYFQVGPAWLMDKDMGPFLFQSLVIPVGLVVPIGSIFLALLVGYGLMEFIGVLVQPIMRPIWKTPGRSAVDAVASFVGSYSIGLLITNRVFKEGKYTVKEAAIIATGFSTVSATFMIVIAKTLDLMSYWNLYFWVTLVVTFIVTALTVRLWPLSKMSDSYYDGQGEPEEVVTANRLQHAWNEAMVSADKAASIGRNIWENLRDGFIMTMGILPSIMSVGLLGLVLAEFTPLFDWVGYIYYPFTWLLQIPEPLLAAKASAIEIAEMFLPALLVTTTPLVTKFIIAVVSVSSILFFSASIPCILSTDIPISIPQLLVIWLERTILTLIITTPIAYLLL
ncbi:YjiH family protein [Brevibacillus fulvus]|uniref:Nucleoside recognition membrane protein YjiH n=1 Tax=Brevibacillus fulvus TaxID=1125967 RepID=A0A939BT37_9BACL|nr:YjiH family protein [Brevibacillus fulvus]MBM7589084.1 nucleoside recognition membrane protein YjiH [Brevibacillus fulvus]